MDYKIENDNEIIYMIHEGNEEACDFLIDKYKYLIKKVINELTESSTLVGIEKIDLYQEGLIGLLSAIKSYKDNKDVLFYTYAYKCIRTHMLTCLRDLNRKKHMILNTSYSLDRVFSNDQDSSLYDVIKDESSNPNKLIIEGEIENEMLSKLFEICSKNEVEILKLKLNGFSNKEISQIINKEKKYIENTLFRIKNKYKKINK